MSSRRRKVVNYLGNRELLKEIHLSKLTYCEFTDPKYQNYDIIIQETDRITKKLIQQAKVNRAKRLNDEMGDRLFLEEEMTNKEIDAYIMEHGYTAKSIRDSEVVFRVMTKRHIPEVTGKGGKIVKAPVNFPPFQHCILNNRGNLKVVGQSHYHNGKFSTQHGKIRDKLARSLMMLVDRYGNRGNWRNYTWLEEKKGAALVRLSEIMLQFDESKSDNPFAWYTTTITRCFTAVLNKEKEHLATKSLIGQGLGMAATFGEQAEQDMRNYTAQSSPKPVSSSMHD